MVMGSQGAHPACIFLAVTLLVTAAATMLLCTAMFTNYWEMISFSKLDVEKFVARNNATHNLVWLYDRKVAKIIVQDGFNYHPFSPLLRNNKNLQQTKRNVRSASHRHVYTLPEDAKKHFDKRSHIVKHQETDFKETNRENQFPVMESDIYQRIMQHNIITDYSDSKLKSSNEIKFAKRSTLQNLEEKSQENLLSQNSDKYGGNNSNLRTYLHRMDKERTNRTKRQATSELVMFLVPMHGGIWTLCVDLPEDQQKELNKQGFGLSGCINYLVPENIDSARTDWIQRMKNLSISCALVCCIILGASAFVGLFGILNRQISAVLVTGVMYILATIFALFCLSIMHFKRSTKRDCVVLDSQVTPELNNTRIYTSGWSLSLGWGGTVTCLGAALLWLLLAKIMRYNPISLS